MIRWILGALVCMVVGVIFIARYFSGVPTLDKLTTVSGDVASAEVETRRSRRSSSQMLAVRIGDRPVAWYLDRFPDFDRVVGSVRPGEKVTAWVDDADNYIWQLEKGGQRIVSYDQVAEAEWSNKRNSGLMGGLFLVVGVAIVGVVVVRKATGASV